MTRRPLTLAILALGGLSVHAADAGRELNWQTPGAPNYVEPVLPAKPAVPAFRLPEVPASATEDQPLSQRLTVRVTSIVVDGSTVLSSEEIRAIVGKYEGTEITSEDLQAMRLALSQAYLARGYVNSGVVIPDQQVQGGVIHLQAIEGALTRIDITGDPHLADGFIRSRIERYVDAPMNVNDIQDALRHLQQSDHIARLDARLAPGEQLGQAVLQIEVVEPARFSVGMSADNHSSSSVGSERGRLNAQTRNLTGYGEQLSLSASLSDGAKDGAVSLEVPLTAWETSLQVYYARSDAEIIEDAFKALDIESQTDSWGVTLSQPVYDDLQTKVSVSLGLEVKHSETELLGVPFSFSPGAQDGESDTTAVQLGIDALRRGDDSVMALRATWRHGIDALDATIFEADAPDAGFNVTGADGEFDLVLAQGLYLKRLNAFGALSDWNDRAQLQVRGTLQYAFDPLMSLEKIAIGGVNTVRGYRENLLVRDNGAGVSLELQLPIPGYTSEPGLSNLIVAPFIDIGGSWDDVDVDTTSRVRDTDEVRYVVGAGLGLLWQPLEGLNATVYWGLDAADNFDDDDPRDGSDSDDLQDDGLHFNVSYNVRF